MRFLKPNVFERNLRRYYSNSKEVTMKKDTEPWHELIYVCPHCRKEFKPEAVGLHVRLCPDCEKKKECHDSLVKDAASYVRSSRATRIDLLEGVVGNQ